MGRGLLETARPPMWFAGRNSGGEDTVRFGKHSFRVSDVTGIAIEENRDRNIGGLLLGAVAFAVAATVFAYVVYERGAMLRFWFGASFLAMLSAAGVLEMRKVRTLAIYQLAITLAGGQTIRFTSVDRDDVMALALRLTAKRAE